MDVTMLKDKTVSKFAKSNRRRPSGRPQDLEFKRWSGYSVAFAKAAYMMESGVNWMEWT